MPYMYTVFAAQKCTQIYPNDELVREGRLTHSCKLRNTKQTRDVTSTEFVTVMSFCYLFAIIAYAFFCCSLSF